MIRRNPYRRPLPSLALALALALLLVAGPAAAGLQRPLSLEVAPAQPQARVGEPIRFEAHTNGPCYLYLYVTDPATGSSTVLLPNRRQADNRLPAGTAVRVPGPEVAYTVATPGVRQVTALASTKPLDLTGEAGKAGDLATLAAKDLEAGFVAKGLGSGVGNLRIGDAELVVRRFDLKVAEAPKPQVPPATQGDLAEGQGIAFVATGGDRFRVGEALRLVFGADRKGWVHLIVITPDGGQTRLARREIDGKTLESQNAQAEAPIGDHTLVAVYTPGPDLDERTLAPLLAAHQDKGLRLVPDRFPAQVAVQRFAIVP